MRRLIVVGAVGLIVAGVAAFVCRRQWNAIAVCKDKRKVMVGQKGLYVPPKNYGEWMKTFGADEPDPNTQEGKDRLQKEANDITKAEQDLSRLLRVMPSVLTNVTWNADEAFVSDVERILSGFSRANRARLLKKVEMNGEVDNFRVDMYLRTLSLDGTFQLAVQRYYRIAGKFADMIWRFGGEEFAAAEADRRLYIVLKSSGKSQVEKSTFISAYIEKWKSERCDNEGSNFCRSHRMAEDVYKRYFADAAKANPKVLKAVSSWYPRHLVWARSILGREPKWSPEFGK